MWRRVGDTARMRQDAAGVTWADGMGWRGTGIAGPSVSSDEVIKSDSSVGVGCGPLGAVVDGVRCRRGWRRCRRPMTKAPRRGCRGASGGSGGVGARTGGVVAGSLRVGCLRAVSYLRYVEYVEVGGPHGVGAAPGVGRREPCGLGCGHGAEPFRIDADRLGSMRQISRRDREVSRQGKGVEARPASAIGPRPMAFRMAQTTPRAGRIRSVALAGSDR